MEKMPRYVKIAHDVTNRILNGEFQEGDILKGRSVLAASYNVSPETIRKALNILQDKKIVEIKHGVGVFVDSIMNAKQYRDSWDSEVNIDNDYKGLIKILGDVQSLHDELEESINQLMDNFRYQTDETIAFQKMVITSDCWLIGKTIGDVYFYNYTEATVVAVKSNGQTITSPGPDYEFKVNDEIIFVCKDDLTFQRVLSFVTFGVEEE